MLNGLIRGLRVHFLVVLELVGDSGRVSEGEILLGVGVG